MLELLRSICSCVFTPESIHEGDDHGLVLNENVSVLATNKLVCKILASEEVE
ncbi:MAG: hypothetical protein WCL02_08045 [bacterium]